MIQMLTLGELSHLYDVCADRPEAAKTLLNHLPRIDSLRPIRESAKCLWVDLKDVLDQLPPERRELVWRVHYIGYGQREEAARLGISQQAVTKQLKTAYRQIARIITETRSNRKGATKVRSA